LQRNLKKRCPDFRPGLGANAHSLNKLSALAAHYKNKHDELHIKQSDSLGASIQTAIAKHGEGLTRSMPYCSFEKFVRAAINGTGALSVLPFRRFVIAHLLFFLVFRLTAAFL
jgi:hypothetical protein